MLVYTNVYYTYNIIVGVAKSIPYGSKFELNKIMDGKVYKSSLKGSG